jgi:hypothetical protein
VSASPRYERRLSSLEALLSPSAPLLPSKTEGVPVVDQQKEPASQRSLLPAELQARARVLPRVEMGAAGSYVLICPREGELPFTTDSLEWFEWFCSLSSFRFIGQSGRFTAYREGQRSWRAYRTFHGQNYKQSLGTTDRLTIARLEEVAGMLQSRLT